VAKQSAKSSDQIANKKPERDVQFVNYDLTADDKERFKAWAHENAGMDAFMLLEKVIEAGFNTSIKWSEFEGCFNCFLIPTDKKPDLKGWLLAGRGSTVFGAVMGALFRHLVLFEEDWPVRSDVKRAVDDDF